MDYSKIDFKQLKEIKNELNLRKDIYGMSSLGQDLLSSPKTKVYLVNEFECQGQNMIVVIIKYWFGIEQKYDYITCIWDKNLALK